MRAAIIAIALLSALACFFGCRDNQRVPHSKSAKVSPNAEQDLKDLSAKVGIDFPTDTVLVHDTDGGGRDSSFGFHQWGLFSPNAITMPAMNAPGVKEYLTLPLESTLKYVQGMFPGRKISRPQSAHSSDWELDGYAFNGTLIRTSQGDYLVIEQFRKK